MSDENITEKENPEQKPPARNEPVRNEEEKPVPEPVNKTPVVQREDDSAVKVAKITAYQAVLVAVLSLVGIILSGYFGYMAAAKTNEKPATVVPEPKNIITVPKLDEATSPGVETIKDISVFDLRAWKEVPESKKNERYSPVNYINYLHVRKVSQVKTYKAHYATSGYAIDLRCITHEQVIRQEAQPEQHAGQNVKEYEVEVNIEDVEVGKEFLIVIEGTYWNSFQNLKEEDVSTYTDEDISELQELAIIVLLPEDKPVKSSKLWSHPTESETKSPYKDFSKFYTEEQGRFIYWSIAGIKQNYHYTITWEW